MSAAQAVPTLGCPDCGNERIVPPNSFSIVKGHAIGRISFACGWSGNVSRGPIYRQIAPCNAPSKPTRRRRKEEHHHEHR